MLFICFIRKKGNGATKLDFNMSLPLQTFDQRAEPTLLYFHPVRRMQKEEVVSALVFTPFSAGICCLVCCFVTFFLLHNCFFCVSCSYRNYTVPDPPGLFDGHVWPMYLKHKNIMETSGVDVCKYLHYVSSNVLLLAVFIFKAEM